MVEHVPVTHECISVALPCEAPTGEPHRSEAVTSTSESVVDQSEVPVLTAIAPSLASMRNSLRELSTLPSGIWMVILQNILP